MLVGREVKESALERKVLVDREVKESARDTRWPRVKKKRQRPFLTSEVHRVQLTTDHKRTLVGREVKESARKEKILVGREVK